MGKGFYTEGAESTEVAEQRTKDAGLKPGAYID
jgi:hypothetical protein